MKQIFHTFIQKYINNDEIFVPEITIKKQGFCFYVVTVRQRNIFVNIH